MSTDGLERLVRPGIRIAIGDGFGAPRALSAPLTRAVAGHRDVRLLLGWVPAPDPGLDPTVFADVRTVMPGWGLRRLVDAGQVHSIPTRLSAVPSLLHGPLRPDLLVATVVRVAGGFAFGSEVSWMRAAVDAGATVAALVSSGVPRCDGGAPLPADRVVVVGEAEDRPLALPPSAPTPEHEAVARRVARLVPEGARVQVGPGQLGDAVLRAIEVPVRIDSGLLPDSVVDLDERGLLVGDPLATLLAGGPRLYEWADRRPLLAPIEVSHDIGRLSAEALFAVNTAVEVDIAGQVNVEGTANAIVGGIGGHADFAAAATRSVGGVSVLGVPTTHRGRSTLVDVLSRPVSTPAHDVGVIVTERGAVDLRGLDRVERTEALRELWGAAGVRPVDRSDRPGVRSSGDGPPTGVRTPAGPPG